MGSENINVTLLLSLCHLGVIQWDWLPIIVESVSMLCFWEISLHILVRMEDAPEQNFLKGTVLDKSMRISYDA